MTEAPYLTPADVARELQISRAAAYRVCRESFGALKVSRSTFKRWIVDRTLPGEDGAEELARRAAIYLGTIEHALELAAAVEGSVRVVAPVGRKRRAS